MKNMSFRIIICLAVISAYAGLSQAGVLVARKAGDTEAKEKPGEIRDLSELRQKRPEEYRRLVTAAQMILARFGYLSGPFKGEMDEATRKAFGQYQRQSGLKETSDLDIGTWQRLLSDLSSVERVPVRLPKFEFFSDSWDSFFSARGTWAGRNRPINEPLQTTEIKCYRELGRCIESTAIVGLDKMLFSGVYIYEVERWDPSAIKTKPMETGCVSYRLSIGRKERTVVAVEAPLKREGGCAQEDGGEEEMSLEDGEKVWMELKRALYEDIERLLVK